MHGGVFDASCGPGGVRGSEDARGGIGVEGRASDFGSGTEEGGADADVGGTFFDGDFEVAGHAHGEVGEVDVEFFL